MTILFPLKERRSEMALICGQYSAVCRILTDGCQSLFDSLEMDIFQTAAFLLYRLPQNSAPDSQGKGIEFLTVRE